MGKRNKFSKIGVSRKNYKTLVKATQRKDKTLNESEMMEDYEEDNKIEETKLNKTNLNKSIINEEAVNKQSSILGIDKEHLMSFIQNPVRHRRAITKIVLSKGQRRRQEKKEKFKRREELVEKIKLDQTMINTTNRTLNLTQKDIINTTNVKKDQFDLWDINNTLGNVLDEIKENKNSKTLTDVKFRTHRDKRNFKKILNEEKEKIKKVIENKNYQSNPLEAMKYHIKNAQLIQERNKKIEENFQKNYNFLNLKK